MADQEKIKLGLPSNDKEPIPVTTQKRKLKLSSADDEPIPVIMKERKFGLNRSGKQPVDPLKQTSGTKGKEITKSPQFTSSIASTSTTIGEAQDQIIFAEFQKQVNERKSILGGLKVELAAAKDSFKEAEMIAEQAKVAQNTMRVLRAGRADFINMHKADAKYLMVVDTLISAASTFVSHLLTMNEGGLKRDEKLELAEGKGERK